MRIAQLPPVDGTGSVRTHLGAQRAQVRTFCASCNFEPPHRQADVVLLVVEDLLGSAAAVMLGEAVREAVALVALVPRLCRSESTRSAKRGGAGEEREGAQLE